MANFTNNNQFRHIIDTYTNGIINEFNSVQRKLSLEAYRSLVQKTAVDTGFARFNQDISVNALNVNEVENNQQARYPDPPVPMITESFPFGSIFFIYNNTKYIIYLEEGIGQRPQPMVAPTMQILQRMSEQLFTELARQNYIR